MKLISCFHHKLPLHTYVLVFKRIFSTPKVNIFYFLFCLPQPKIWTSPSILALMMTLRCPLSEGMLCLLVLVLALNSWFLIHLIIFVVCLLFCLYHIFFFYLSALFYFLFLSREPMSKVFCSQCFNKLKLNLNLTCFLSLFFICLIFGTKQSY